MSVEPTRDWTVSDTPLQFAFESSRHLSAYQRDWELGRWDQLAAIDCDAYEPDSDAAFFALLVASANQVIGNRQRVCECIDYAMARGCSRYTAIQVLISGVHNLLGRARLAAGQNEAAGEQFRNAVKLGARQGRESLVAAARQEEERHQLELRQSEFGGDRQLANAVAGRAQRDPGTREPAILTYRQAPRELVESDSAPFILLDSKSLPRSGLHYMRKRFAEALGSRFSFCEWYQEPGCCGQRPCALTGFLRHRRSQHDPKVRLIKSHDFDLDDPVDEPAYCLRRVILVRDPVYILTSWFAFDQIEQHRDELTAFSIDTRKLQYSHEPEIVDSIYEILEDRFTPPAEQYLATWLNRHVEYIQRFTDKWIPSEESSSNPHVHVIDYTDIDSFVRSIFRELEGDSVAGMLEMDARGGPQEGETAFAPRTDPFRHRCNAIESYLRAHADEFSRAAAVLRAMS